MSMSRDSAAQDRHARRRGIAGYVIDADGRRWALTAIVSHPNAACTGCPRFLRAVGLSQRHHLGIAESTRSHQSCRDTKTRVRSLT
jgi:hypothetical protein